MGVTDFEMLKQLILLEDFKSCLPDKAVTYLNENKVSEVNKATIFADYVLTHKTAFGGLSFSSKPFENVNFNVESAQR